MKYLSLPKKLIIFWYPESLIVWLRVWKNSIQYLEEDLAVGLMWKLFFVPLFHDNSIVGKLLSIVFRLTRILIGLFAFFFVTVLLFSLTLIWFSLPILSFILPSELRTVAQVLLFSGLVLFAKHIIAHPEKKVWQIKNSKEIWKCSFLKPQDLNFSKLLITDAVKNLLAYLELSPDNFTGWPANLPSDLIEEKALEIGKTLLVPYLSAEHFFVAFLQSTYDSRERLIKIERSLEDFIYGLEYLKLKENNWRMVNIWDEDFAVKHLKGINRGWLGVPTPNLDLVSRDLTKEASSKTLTNFVGRQDQLSKIINILSMEKGRNVVIVGEPGVGKTALVEHLAEWIVSGDAPGSLATKRLMELDLIRLLSGIKTQGELAERIKNIFEEIKFHGNIVLFVDEIQALGMGEAGVEFNLYSLILPFIESSDFQFIGATEPENYSRILEKNSAFARLFAKIDLTPATALETLPIIMNLSLEKERFRKIKISLPAQKTIVFLSERYVHDKVLPDSAAATFTRCLEKAQNNWVTKKIVESTLQEISSIPIGEAGEQQKKELLNLENIIHTKMIDQVEAVQAVCQTLKRAAVELREENRPIGTFLFVGPTGVGKTELAKILSEVYFQGKGKFLRLDMSEYQTDSSAEKMIGASGESGYLTENVRTNPYSLILLDEFEKASPKVLTLFLQVLEDGRLTDGEGKTVDFTNTIIIATSNAGSLEIANGLSSGKSWEGVKKQAQEDILKVFKPELINRFDEVVIFKPLSKEDLQKIVQLKLSSLQKQLENQGYMIDFNQALVGELAKKGFDPVLGARPLRRLIQDTIEAKLSELILQNKLPKGEMFQAGVELLN